MYNVYSKINVLYVILSGGWRVRPPTEVEVLLRERAARGDDPIQNREALADAGYGCKSRWLAIGMLHLRKKSPKHQAISLRRIRSSVLLVRFAQPAKLRLRKTQAFFSAQNDRLVVCFVGCVCFGRSKPLPYRLDFCFVLFRK